MSVAGKERDEQGQGQGQGPGERKELLVPGPFPAAADQKLVPVLVESSRE